jgi:hypothetical protein
MLGSTHCLLRQTIAIGSVLAALACRSEPRPRPPEAQPDAGAACPVDPPGEANDGEPWSLENVCDRWPALICRTLEACCGRSRTLFEKFRCNCETAHRELCEKNTLGVRQGRLRFHPDRIEACLGFVDRRCTTLIVDSVEDRLMACSPIFEGDQPQGAPCERDGDCEQPPEDVGTAWCRTAASTSELVCTHLELRREGEPCTSWLSTVINLGFPPETIGICVRGLYCRAPSPDETPDSEGSDDPAGVCTPELALGAECSADGYAWNAPFHSAGCVAPAVCDWAVRPRHCVDSGRRLPGEPCADHGECFYHWCIDGTCGPNRRAFCSDYGVATSLQ